MTTFANGNRLVWQGHCDVDKSLRRVVLNEERNALITEADQGPDALGGQVWAQTAAITNTAIVLAVKDLMRMAGVYK